MKTLRKYKAVGPSKGEGPLTKKQAEVERDKFLANLNTGTIEAATEQLASTGVALFAEIAKMYEEGYLGRINQIARPTREKETFYLHEYLVPWWGKLGLNQIKPQAVEDWLHTTFDSWWTMHGARAIMTRIFNYAEGHGLWEEGKRSPSSRAKLGKKHHKYERRILSFEETARLLNRIEELYKLIVETCIATGARISEILGLEWRHVDLDAGVISIEQRVWHQEVGPSKSEGSRGVLGIGDLAQRYCEKAQQNDAQQCGWVFYQKRAPEGHCGTRESETHYIRRR
jgi:integrase